MMGGEGVDVGVLPEEEAEQGKRCVEMWMTRPSGNIRGMRVAEANHSSAVSGGGLVGSPVLLEGMCVCMCCLWCVKCARNENE